MLKDRRLAVLGAGKLGETLIQGLLEAGAIDRSRVTVTTAHGPRLELVRERLGVAGTLSNAEAVQDADIVLLAVKPQQVPLVMSEIGGVLRPSQLLISVAASVSAAFIEKHLREPVPVVRAMPNTPCLIRVGMTGIAMGKHARQEHLEIARRIFEAVGRTVIADEKHMDAITALSASGPAYIYIIIESLAEAGVKVGLPRDMATELAAQTVVGAGEMVLRTGEHPAKLKDMVTTPAGCTIDGILELEDGGLRVTLIKAVVCATRRARELLES
ncbi:MAG: pyrroline-5-carboxylate reductase [Candidatus Eisenbacteria bacterium RBG_16_71_46]|nr:MAG: pyrroline-5-carboxylate reductase [Candidatus Eisenbacteria bacterium RBG_16_71_46]